MRANSGKSLRDGFLFLGIRFFRLRSSPDKAARGFGIGVACNFFPTFGLGGFISGFLARIFGGDMIAGFLGGALLAPFWPLVFYANVRVGGLFLRPPVLLDELDDVTPQTVHALVWGQTFAIGSAVNSLIAGCAAYFLFLLAYERIRPHALHWLRRKARGRKAPRTARARPPFSERCG